MLLFCFGKVKHAGPANVLRGGSVAKDDAAGGWLELGANATLKADYTLVAGRLLVQVQTRERVAAHAAVARESVAGLRGLGVDGRCCVCMLLQRTGPPWGWHWWERRAVELHVEVRKCS